MEDLRVSFIWPRDDEFCAAATAIAGYGADSQNWAASSKPIGYQHYHSMVG
jgi:hypothetical protein